MVADKTVSLLVSLFVLTSPAVAQEWKDYNKKIVDTVDWLAKNKASLGYDLKSRYTDNLKYGSYVFPGRNSPNTMCVAAVFEIIVRSLADARQEDGTLVSDRLMPGQVLGGSSALSVAPYIFQYRSNAMFPEYGRKFSAGAGDAFVLFGMGRYVAFEAAKAGDFIYFNRAGGGGHAAVFISYLNKLGAPSDGKSAVGFRYFSAQKGGTNGLGYRDAFFGGCPSVKTDYVKDCEVIRSSERRLLSVSRLHHPSEWQTSYSAIRVQRFFKGDSIETIFEGERAFRKRTHEELLEAEKSAKEYAKKGLFPLIVPPIAGEATIAEDNLRNVEFSVGEFGPEFPG
ncbi:hypothetical protein P3W70_18155 [Achromobacter denitrificans]|uniref:hypothetical protein n=1 Tax=Achromobacter denitrificans TaxID=32002 RepID=UPI0023E880B8|nr:hypothetical protein [Achromobacter denitrificans]MDF3860285.1 hypothetical protein [Achromobacter denitrificans]